MASIRKRGKGYQITVSSGYTPDGKKQFKTVTWHPDPDRTDRQNEKALQQFAGDFERKVQSGQILDGAKMTLTEFIRIWQRDYVKKELKDTSATGYEYMVDKHIIPEIGHLRLTEVTPLRLNALYDKLLTERKDNKSGGYSARTVRHVHATLCSIYALAVRWRLIAANDDPTAAVKPPRTAFNASRVKYFTADQANAFLAYLDTFTAAYRTHCPDQIRIFFELAIYGGLRRGELIALTWNDIDLDHNIIDINKETVITKNGIKTDTPKSARSVRLVAIPEFIMYDLKKYKVQQLQYRLSIGNKWIDDNSIFIRWNGQQMYPTTPDLIFKKIIKEYNKKASDPLPNIPLHGLRHTNATLLIHGGMNAQSVSDRLGHAQTSTTMNIYSHELREANQAAADILQTMLRKCQ